MNDDEGQPRLGALTDEQIAQARKDLEAARVAELAIAKALHDMEPRPDAGICVTACAILLGRMLAIADSKSPLPLSMKGVRMTATLSTVTASYDAQTDLIGRTSAAAGTNGKGKS